MKGASFGYLRNAHLGCLLLRNLLKRIGANNCSPLLMNEPLASVMVEDMLKEQLMESERSCYL